MPSLTEALDNLYTTTWEHRKAEVQDNIFTSTPFWFWMKNKNKFKTVSAGRFIMYPLEYAKNESVTWVSKGDAVSLNDFEFLTESKWDWCYLTGGIVRFGVEEQQNRGKQQIISLMNSRMNNLQNSMIDTLETSLFTAKGSTKQFHGLPDLIPTTQAYTTAVGGITASVDTWWQATSTTMTGLSFAVYGIPKMRTMLNACMNNRQSDAVDLILTTQTVYEYYEDETMEQKQIVNKTLGDAGFQNIEFKGIPIIWSPQCTSQAMYFINTNFLYFVYDPAMYFDMTEWKAIPDQVNDRAAQVITACAFIVTRKKCQGVLHTIDTA